MSEHCVGVGYGWYVPRPVIPAGDSSRCGGDVSLANRRINVPVLRTLGRLLLTGYGRHTHPKRQSTTLQQNDGTDPQIGRPRFVCIQGNTFSPVSIAVVLWCTDIGYAIEFTPEEVALARSCYSHHRSFYYAYFESLWNFLHPPFHTRSITSSTDIPLILTSTTSTPRKAKKKRRTLAFVTTSATNNTNPTTSSVSSMSGTGVLPSSTISNHHWKDQNTLLHVLSLLDAVSVCVCARVCSSWRQVANSQEFEGIWSQVSTERKRPFDVPTAFCYGSIFAKYS
ncbi:hypothetical protein Pelo_18688 [Pelomyxa schiedti]|nr:hypothetical protein Pelo_18688 [Pelomyxa schiedti]